MGLVAVSLLIFLSLLAICEGALRSRRAFLDGMVASAHDPENILAVTIDADYEHRFAKMYLKDSAEIELYIWEPKVDRDNGDVYHSIIMADEMFPEDDYQFRLDASSFLNETFEAWLRGQFAPYEVLEPERYEVIKGEDMEEPLSKAFERAMKRVTGVMSGGDGSFMHLQGHVIEMEEPFDEASWGRGIDTTTGRFGSIDIARVKRLGRLHPETRPHSATLYRETKVLMRECADLFSRDVANVKAQVEAGELPSAGTHEDEKLGQKCWHLFRVYDDYFHTAHAILDAAERRMALGKPKPTMLFLEVHGECDKWGDNSDVTETPGNSRSFFLFLNDLLAAHPLFENMDQKVFMTCSLHPNLGAVSANAAPEGTKQWIACGKSKDDEEATIVGFTPWGYIAKSSASSQNFNKCYKYSYFKEGKREPGLYWGRGWHSVPLPNVHGSDIFVAYKFCNLCEHNDVPPMFSTYHADPSSDQAATITNKGEDPGTTVARWQAWARKYPQSLRTTFSKWDPEIKENNQWIDKIQHYCLQYIKETLKPLDVENKRISLQILSALGFEAANRGHLRIEEKDLLGQFRPSSGPDNGDAVVHEALRGIFAHFRSVKFTWGPHKRDPSNIVVVDTTGTTGDATQQNMSILDMIASRTEIFRQLWRSQPNRHAQTWLESRDCASVLRPIWLHIKGDRLDCSIAMNRILGTRAGVGIPGLIL